jgi:hypothetical protein
MPRLLFLLMLCLLPLAVQNPAQKTQTSRTHPFHGCDPRVEMSLRDGWRFKLGPESATELQAEPDATWTTVSVPHTWNRVGLLQGRTRVPHQHRAERGDHAGRRLVQARLHAASERGRHGKLSAI